MFLIAAIERANENSGRTVRANYITQFVSGRFVVKDGMVTSDERITKAELKIASETENPRQDASASIAPEWVTDK